MMLDSQTDKLARWIDSHDCGASPTFRGIAPDGRLLVACAVIEPNGTATTVVETIDATVSAARNWLGY